MRRMVMSDSARILKAFETTCGDGARTVAKKKEIAEHLKSREDSNRPGHRLQTENAAMVTSLAIGGAA
jgi:hypothetical protein